MTRDITPAGSPATGSVDEAFAEVRASFDRFCLAAGIEALDTMMEADVTAACGPRRESVVEGDPPHLRFGRCDPALPDPQGAQHRGTPAERASCGHPSGAAPGLGA